MSDERKLSPVEGAKLESNYLRGTIAQELTDGTDKFSDTSEKLLKHFGTYQQDDRDARALRRAEAGGKAYMFMVRTKLPGGILTSEQLLAELDLGDELGNDTLRITSRQGLQLHGVLKENLAKTIQRINEIQLSTLGACGDVNRNVMCCPAPVNDPVHVAMRKLANDLAAHFAPRGGAYHEIWLRDLETKEEERVAHGSSSSNGSSNGAAFQPLVSDGPGNLMTSATAAEPIYGQYYLPRKFKIAVGLPEDNCIDLLTNDLGFLAVHDGAQIQGYNVYAGGGLGVTPSAKKTFPALGQGVCYIPADRAVAIAEAIIKVQRDHGNREDRKTARLKYLIANWGIEKFRAAVAEYYGAPLQPLAPVEIHGFDDHIGWTYQKDGRWCYGLNVENGRIKDEGDFRLKTAIREICRTYRPGIRLTAHQSILFTDLRAEDRGAVEAILKNHGIKLSSEISEVRRWSMACVAWPTCGLSITEAERALPGMIDLLEAELAKLGLSAEQFTVRMTGCPNGCARPYNSDIGIVGKSKDKYSVFVGGALLGTRLNFLYKDSVEHDDVIRELVPLFVYCKTERKGKETFGDFCHRKGKEDLLAWCEKFQPQPASA